MNNPFSTSFGLEPSNYISRLKDEEKIISDFNQLLPSNYTYILTGVRGSGKTVLLYSIANRLKQEEDWIVANIGPKRHMLEALAAELYEQGKMKHLFLKAEFSFSFKGFGLSIQGKEPISDIMTLLKKLISYLTAKGKKILIIIDEVDNSEEMKLFIQGYASLLGQRYPMRLLMTGLYKNISKLQDEKSLTFLYRAPKIHIGPLSISSIAFQYSKLLNVSQEKAIEFAKFTKGYAYAYQVLGLLLFDKSEKEIDAEVLAAFDQYLSEYVYGKLYFELSPMSKKVVNAIKDDKPIKMEDLSKALKKTTKYLSAYRDNLIKEGIIYSPSYGYVQFALPRFEAFLKNTL